MTAKQTALRRGLFTVAVATGVLLLGAPVAADPLEKVRENLFRRQGGEGAGPLLARYVSEQGRVFILDRTQPIPMLKFENSPEVWALQPAPAPRGDMIYKNDLGEPVLRATRLGGFTLFTDSRPSGEAVSFAGGAPPLRLTGLSPQALGERLLQASIRSSRAARRQVAFEAEATPASAALIADAATIVSLAFLQMAARDGGRAGLAKVGRVQIMEGRKASAAFRNGILQVVVAPVQGVAGRPSSDKVVHVLRDAR
jgi:hypothetical protein